MFMPCTYLYSMTVQLSTLKVDQQVICKLSNSRVEEGPQHAYKAGSELSRRPKLYAAIIKLH
jgi:hypothetical protein